MGGVSVDEGGKGGRKSTNAEINMIPMIDLLMVTISFLLITAVWTTMARINADAQVPGPPRPDVEQTKEEPEKQLHVEMRAPDKFQLIWKQGANVVNTRDIPRKDNVITNNNAKLLSFPELSREIESDWKVNGSHRDPSDKKFDTCILHTDNETPYFQVIAVIDAIYGTHRPFAAGGKTEQVPAFNVTFSVN